VRPAAVVVLVAVAAACGAPDDGTVTSASVPASRARPSVLVFTRTAAFRHPSIVAGIEAVTAIGAEEGFAVEATEDAATFTDDRLARFGVVVWLSTSGDVLDDAQQTAFERWVRAGGAYVGVHAAADTEYDWPFYGGLVGAWFASHPAPHPDTLVVTDRSHPSTAHLGPTWDRTDEWYSFRTPPRAGAHVLLTRTGPDGVAQPLAWCGPYEGGRSWYTALGHDAEAFGDPAFRRHLAGGITSVAGPAPAAC